MFGWAIIFLIIAFVATILGLSNLAAVAAGIAKLLFSLFFILYVALFITGLTSRRT